MDDWDFKGHFLSDCWAIRDFHTGHMVTGDVAESSAMALNYGVSLNCGNSFPALKEALERGLVTEATIDKRLATLFITRFELGLFDPPSWNPYKDIDESVINCEEHEDLAYEAALKSMVLLKNNGALPLKNDLRKLYVTGPQANNSTVLLGNYYGVSNKLVNILEGIASRVSAGTTLDYRMGAQESVKNINPVDWASGGARDHDATIVVLGISQLLEGEEGESLASPSLGDRLDLNLPANQLDYLRKLKAGHDNPVIVVITGGSPITMPEVEELADAILWVWYPGQAGGLAVADLIFGNKVPSGKLPLTFPESVDQLPPYEDYSMKERTYRYMTANPLYPFGYGLSYSEFLFNDLYLDREEISADESLTVSVKVKNNGAMDADEVVQLYVSVPDRDGIQPRWSLKNFTRVSLEKSSSTEVSFKLTGRALEQFNQEGKAEVIPGEYKVYVGNGSPGKRSKELGVQLVSASFHVK
jgi:beta-glucosidase